MHWPVTSLTDACTSQAYACMCMHCPMMLHAVTALVLLFPFHLGYTFTIPPTTLALTACPVSLISTVSGCSKKAKMPLEYVALVADT